MNNFCKQCGICCKLIPVKCADKILVRDGFQIPSEDFEKLLEPLTKDEACSINEFYVQKVQEIFPDARFYSCKALSQDNNCTLSERPAYCKDFPHSPLAIIPEECGYTGEIFVKNEELKRKIRKTKEEIIDYEALAITDKKNSASYKKIIENLTRFVDKYSDFGSKNW